MSADPWACQALASEGLAEALARACLLGAARAVAAALLPGEAGQAAGEQALALLKRLLLEHGSGCRWGRGRQLGCIEWCSACGCAQCALRQAGCCAHAETCCQGSESRLGGLW